MHKIPIIIFSALMIVHCRQKPDLSYSVCDVSEPRISLNGIWKVTHTPPETFWNDTTGFDHWQDVQVPGECLMQGLPIEHDKPFVYKTIINIPEDYFSKRIYVQFDGVYCDARVWISGREAGQHFGGFTRWLCDITPFVNAGESVCLTVEVTDRIDDISYASGYAKHPIGGILRDVHLLALPDNFPEQVSITTDLDAEYQDAILTIAGEMKNPDPGGRIELKLTDKNAANVELETASLVLKASTGFSIQNRVRNPDLWDAEHPNCYRLTLAYFQQEKRIWKNTVRIGFREIEVSGSKLLVNGREVKLRGACRHDMHPTLGRSTSAEYDLKDVLLAKEANMNFIRTSHYPPSESFLDYCDLYGLYVEEETAVCFVDTWRSDSYKAYGASQDDTAFTERYLGQLSEMIDRDRNHPSVLIWSIGNENKYGTNFRKSFEYGKMADKTRPVIFSYPGLGSDDPLYDILSVHYPGYQGQSEQYGFKIENFAYPGLPALFDEWAHVACYNTGTLITDPNVRDFWGQSLDRMWSNCFDSEGALGGAIWGMIDEIFLLPDTCVGYGPWGIVDIWRRPKPEFWNTKKAYSPIRLKNIRAVDFRRGEDVYLELKNRFDHTNINELKILCNGQVISSPDIQPHQTGILKIPGSLLRDDTPVDLAFYKDEALVDRVRFNSRSTKTERPGREGLKRPIQVLETEKELDVTGDDFQVTFSKATGLIISAGFKGEEIIKSGPFIRLGPPELGEKEGSAFSENIADWQLGDKQWKHDDSSFVATVSGFAGGFPVAMTIAIDARAEMQIGYELSHTPAAAGEAGLFFYVADRLDQISWDRQAYWSDYPEGHLGRPSGFALKTGPWAGQERYGKRPPGLWENDTRDYYLEQVGRNGNLIPVTNDFRAAKMNIYSYALTNSRTGDGLEVYSDGSLACQTGIEAGGDAKLSVLGHLSYPDLDWGNYEGEAKLANPFKSHVRIRLIRGDHEYPAGTIRIF